MKLRSWTVRPWLKDETSRVDRTAPAKICHPGYASVVNRQLSEDDWLSAGKLRVAALGDGLAVLRLELGILS